MVWWIIEHSGVCRKGRHLEEKTRGLPFGSGACASRAEVMGGCEAVAVEGRDGKSFRLPLEDRSDVLKGMRCGGDFCLFRTRHHHALAHLPSVGAWEERVGLRAAPLLATGDDGWGMSAPHSRGCAKGLVVITARSREKTKFGPTRVQSCLPSRGPPALASTLMRREPSSWPSRDPHRRSYRRPPRPRRRRPGRAGRRRAAGTGRT